MSNDEKVCYKYSYDSSNRLTGISIDDVRLVYEYDSAGNMVSRNMGEEATGSPATTELPRAFVQFANQHRELYKRFQQGELSLNDYYKELYALRIQDERGYWWQINEHGEWLKWNGQTWLKDDPALKHKQQAYPHN